MSSSSPQRPTFVAPDSRWAEPPEPPTPQRAREIRLWTVGVLVVCSLVTLISLLGGRSEVAAGFWFLLAVLAAAVNGSTSYPRQRRAQWVFKAAWLGERAGPPPRPMSKRDEARYRKAVEEERAFRASEEAIDAVPHRANEIRRWLEIGMPRAQAPDAALVVPATAIPPTVEVSSLELEAISTAMFASELLDRSVVLSGETEDERARRVRLGDAADALLAKGILQRAGLGFDLSAELLPLVGLAVVHDPVVSILWTDDGIQRRRHCFSAPGHFIVQDTDLQSARESSEPSATERSCFARSSIDIALDHVIALIARPAPTESTQVRCAANEVWLYPRQEARVIASVDERGRFELMDSEGATVAADLTVGELRGHLRPLLTG